MPVLDASVVAEYLGAGALGDQASVSLFGDDRTRWVPHLLDAEVGHVLRRLVAKGELAASAGAEAVEELHGLPLARTAHGALMPRAWELRDNVSFYDAIYVALAERIGCELITLDTRLARAVGDLIEVVVLSDE